MCTGLGLFLEVKPPVRMDVSLEGKYTSVSCSKASSEKVLTALQSKLTTLDCVKKGTCDAKPEAKQCEQGGIKHKRSATGSMLTVAINLKSTVKTDGSDFNFSSVAANTSGKHDFQPTFINRFSKM